MAGPAKTGGKRSAAKTRRGTRSSSPKTKRHGRSKRYTASDGQLTDAQLAATAEILKIIARSPSDLQRVFKAILEGIERLVDGDERVILLAGEDGMLRLGAAHSPRALHKIFPIPLESSASGLAIRERRLVAYANVLNDPAAPPAIKEVARRTKAVSVAIAPLLSETRAVGTITVTRSSPDPFSEKERALLSTFADQAVIAVENARLFNEVQAKTMDLEESLRQQTATADVLKVISRSAFNLDSVMNALTQSASLLCKAELSALYLQEGDVLVVRGLAHVDAARADFLRRRPLRVDDSTYIARTFQSGIVRNIADIAAETETGQLKRFGETLGFRSILFVPLMREGRSIGIFALARTRTGEFSQRDVELVQTFADQAVIAVENVRLFDEVQAKTRDLSEALTYQTGSANILSVIASSPADVQPVMNAIVKSACELCGAYDSVALLMEGDDLVFRAHHGPIPMHSQKRSINRRWTAGRAFIDKKPVHVHDLQAEWDEFPEGMEMARDMGHRSIVSVPLLREGESVGALVLRRLEVSPFSDKQIGLLQTFADQAVIAIENARLFNETQEALERQTATADILKVIASSPNDVKPVFDAIATSANRLLGGFSTAVIRFADGIAYLQSFTPTNPAADEVLKSHFPRPIEGFEVARLAQRGGPATIIDTETVEDTRVKDIARLRGFRSMLIVPLMNGNVSIGTISVTRAATGSFAKHHIQLLQTFAAQAVIAIENTRLFNETREGLERQTATAEILKVIASSPSDVRPVFEAIVGSAARLFEPCAATIVTCKDEKLHWQATAALREDFSVERARAVYPLPFDPERHPSALAIAERRIIEIPDTEAPDVLDTPRRTGRISGFRSATFVPLIADGGGIGAIVLSHPQPGFRLSEKQLELVQTFADQAVIAIQNAGLFNDTNEALERQTATADILKVIASSPDDVQPVFEAIAERSNRLIGGSSTAVFSVIEDKLHLMSFTSVNPVADATLKAITDVPLSAFPVADAIRNHEISQIADTEVNGMPAFLREVARQRGWRSALTVPMVREGKLVGTIAVTRADPGLFDDHHVQLLKTFADQAVIAIENVRLFNETKEALAHQTATSDVLHAIGSSMADTQPVFERILDSVERLFDSRQCAVMLAADGMMHLAARRGIGAEAMDRFYPVPLAQTMAGDALEKKQQTYVPSALRPPASPVMRRVAETAGDFSVVLTPMLWQRRGIGVINLSRAPNAAFSEKELALLRTFADQAVIAIQNARLFNETKEALERQTATADVLNVIGRSPTDAAPVFDVIGERAEKLCDAEISVVSVLDDDLIRLAGIRGISKEDVELFRAQFPLRLDRETVTSRTISSGTIIHVSDVLTDPLYDNKKLAAQTGYRSCLGVPMHNKGQVVGAIFVARTEPGPFSDNQIQLLQIFADQAVIAIQNVRLFKETQEALERQTATADILKVIAGSPDDVQPVFEAIAERSNQIVDGRATAVYSLVNGVLHLMAFTPTNPEADASLRAFFPRPLSELAWGDAIGRGSVYQIPDLQDPAFPQDARRLAQQRGYRGVLIVPLVSERKTIGAISVTRVAAGNFTDHHIQLLQTFADQAVIAISNVQLFREVQQRTFDLSKSLDDLRAAQDRLVQTEKLASLGQLTAGIAHEIKNPLNFINNFSQLSTELLDELAEVFQNTKLDEVSRRKELDEIRELLKSNLEKVVQHGKRADSIVKNMLLHSREGSGEQRTADINALVDESLNLAYHGARAEKSGFNITLQRDYDPSAGSAELFPQEITRALLNLLSNGFYAANKRSSDGVVGFEPILLAATKSLGNSVEIRIRDNGAGIPSDIQEKIFNPFFTTKPAGEGTGLGLSMTHDIVVKQHGGTIRVNTEPGVFTEFIITLPRAISAQSTQGSKN